MVLDRGPIGSSRALSLWLCTGPTRPAEWRLRGSSPSEHLVGAAFRTPRIRERAGRGMPYADPYRDGSSAVKNPIRQGRHDRLGIQRHEILGWPEARADPTSGTQRVVSYLVSTTPSGNVRVSTRRRFTQLSRAVKNGVPPPTRTGWVTSAYSSISPARMAAAASVAPAMSIGPPWSALSLVISVTASPVTRRVFQSTFLVVEENTTFGMSRQRPANSIAAGVASGCWSAVGQWELIVSHSLRPYSARPVAPTRSDHHWNSSSLGALQPRSSPGAAM